MANDDFAKDHCVAISSASSLIDTLRELLGPLGPPFFCVASSGAGSSSSADAHFDAGDSVPENVENEARLPAATEVARRFFLQCPECGVSFQNYNEAVAHKDGTGHGKNVGMAAWNRRDEAAVIELRAKMERYPHPKHKPRTCPASALPQPSAPLAMPTLRSLDLLCGQAEGGIQIGAACGFPRSTQRQ